MLQVLAKFEGFPIKKLETVRAAASLYLRMSSLAQQIEDWRITSPISDHLSKITTFFEKVGLGYIYRDRNSINKSLQVYVNTGNICFCELSHR
jgi:hypothetical protein